MAAETFVFQAEINQLLSLIINAFYSDKDVFLRELVSNASDALDKQRYSMLMSGAQNDTIDQLGIRISFDSEANTFTIEDNGIGMTRAELVENLGTIAKSGTKQFMEALVQKTSETANTFNANLIGQFGMGFYSAFLVATSVEVYSKSDAEDKGHKWTSNASGTFEVSGNPDTPDTLDAPVFPMRGTRIVMHLKDDCAEYMSEGKVREILKKHSEFVAYPIEMLVEEEQRVENPEGGQDDKDGQDGQVEDENEEDITAADTPVKFVKIKVWKQINTNKAIWSRRPDDVTAEEYELFYRGFTADWQAPLCNIHFHAEGQFEFDGLFFVPQHPPFDTRAPSNKNNVKLYVNRIFVTDNIQGDVLPEYLGFARGLVDSGDLPLNISREMLQKSKVLSVIKRTVIKKIIDALVDLASSKPEAYMTFWIVYGKYIRWGITDDAKHRDKLAELLRFPSTKTEDALTSLSDYVDRMKPDQDAIYYITGESKQSVVSSVFLDAFKTADTEVLFMTDAIDEYMIQSLQEFRGKKLVSVSAPQAAKDTKEVDESHKKLCECIKEIMGDEVTRVVITQRIVDAPCAIVTEGYGPSANMERILKAQAIQADNPLMSPTYRASRVMEINVNHPLVKAMLEDEVRSTETFERRVRVMYGAGLLASGFVLDNPAAFAKMVVEDLV